MNPEKSIAGHGDLNDRLRMWKRNFLLALKKRAKDAKAEWHDATAGSEKEEFKAGKDKSEKPVWLSSFLSSKNKHKTSAISASLQNIESGVLDNPDFLSSNSVPPSYFAPPAIVHLFAHKPAKEEELLKEIVDLVCDLEESDQSPSTGWVHKATRLSKSLQRSGSIAESVDLSWIWVPLMIKFYSEHTPTYASYPAPSYHNFSFTLSAQKEHKQSALDIRRILQDDDPTFAQTYASSLHGSAYVLIKLKRYKEALPYLEEAIAIREKLAESGVRMHNFDLACSYSRLGQCIAHLKPREDSIEHFRKSIELHRTVGSFTRFEKASMALTLGHLSYHLGKLGKPFEALPLLQEAVEMFKELASTEPKAYSCCLGPNVRNLRVCRIWVMYLKVYHSLKSSVGLSIPMHDV